MNRLERSLKKFDWAPQWMKSKVLENVIPYVGTSSVHFERIANNEVITTLKNKRSVRNHIGQIHAAAMFLLAETATGIVVGMNAPDDRLVLVKSMKADFVRRSKGSMRAVASLTAEQIEQIKTTPKGETYVSVVITDASNEEPIKVEALWAWTAKKK